MSRGVFRHLLYNRGSEPRKAGSDDVGTDTHTLDINTVDGKEKERFRELPSEDTVSQAREHWWNGTMYESAIISSALGILDEGKLDREWVVRNVLGGMAAGFGLRVILDCHPIFTTAIILAGWIAKTAAANLEPGIVHSLSSSLLVLLAMASPTSQTFLRHSSFGGSSVSPSPPADRATFDLSHGGSSVSGSSPPHDQLTFNPYADVQHQGSRVTALNHSTYPASISSASTTRGPIHENQEDVYRERPKGSSAPAPLATEIQAPPPYSPQHQHSSSSHDTPFALRVPSMGAAAVYLHEPRQSEVQLAWRGEEGGGQAQPAIAGRNPPDEFVATSKQRPWYKRPIFWIFLLGVIGVIVAVIVPVYFVVIKKHSAAAQSAGGSSTPPAGGGPSGGPNSITGGDGSVIYADGSPSFTYSNPFGGTWYYDPEDPFNNNAQANEWTPPLNTSWDYGKNRINGVNLGGLFVLEPLTTPFYFQTYPGSIDEWTLSQMMTANGSLQSQIENHYNTFITEQDIAEIAGAGLNWIRLPIGYWAIETWQGEPYLEKVCWKYILRILQWARKYGLRVNLDLNAIPGSQNGLNHSGRFGSINFLNGVMGIANAQRTLDYIRILTEFISQPEWTNVVPMFSVLNEPEQTQHIGNAQMYSFYLKVHNLIRGITGIGKGPFIAISDGFAGVGPSSTWTANILSGADRIALDTHLYFAFSSPEPLPFPQNPCTQWAQNINASKSTFGVTFAGEFSAGFNDCGLFVRGARPNDTATDESNCGLWSDHTQWNSSVISSVLQFTLSSMDAAQIGNSTAGVVGAPLWSYQLGLQYGWMPKDPRQAITQCEHLGVFGAAFDGQFQPWQTGSSGAGVIAPTFVSQYGQWPPALTGGFSNTEAATLLPMYTSTGTVASLPPPTLTASATRSISVGNGWADPSDTAGGITAVAGCAYPNAWSAVGVAVPTPCGGALVAAAATVTSSPKLR
ncbi:hypothetical protein HWV62_4790 [Athelia sp. TMB]|nr:hypothetical protein HWV62_4790 [Athelia sp. TMB]